MSLRAWFELLRVPAILTVPGDALAGAASVGLRPDRGTFCAAAASVCLYEAGMALNDWADRAEDAVDRPHRPLPSGRVRPTSALLAAGALTAAGIALASRAGRPAAVTAGALAATVWAYDLGLKRTAWGPAAMGAARGLDVVLGAAATGRGVRSPTARTAAVVAAHTLAVTAISRHETTGGSSRTPLAALVLAGAIAAVTARPPAARETTTALFGPPPTARGTTATSFVNPLHGAAATAALYTATAARPYLHAALHPSPHLTQQAVSGGIRALIPLQAALTARSGRPLTAAALLTLTPVARRLFRKVSAT
ncbi:SCO3242 family prenyltransferase [Streptomyces sp. NPDC060194]|uniref:SCO3242 family prenyltransferase n=1 Tax=Streptomyces sp. NPDC060194 TaxID=3347069 RepID=UPI003658BABA